MDTNFFKKYEGIINKLSVKHQIPPSKIENVLSHFFKQLYTYLIDPRMPKIQITNFGTFRANTAQMLRSFRKKFFWYRIGAITDEDLREYLRRWWPIYRRLKAEKRGEITTTLWDKVDKNNYPESYYEQKEQFRKQESEKRRKAKEEGK